MTLKKAIEKIGREEQKAEARAQKLRQEKQAYQLGRKSGLKAALSVLSHVDEAGAQGAQGDGR